MPHLHLQMMNPSAHSYDIDDGIHRADLVKVNLLHVHIMDFRLGMTQKLKGSDRHVLHL